MRQMCSFTCFLIKVASSFYFDCTFLLLNYWKTLRVHWCTLIKLSPVGIVLFRPSVVSNFLQPHGMQHPRLSCPSPSPRVCSYSCPLSRWCHPTISPSVVLFSSCPQSLPASGSFPASQLFVWSGQSTWPKIHCVTVLAFTMIINGNNVPFLLCFSLLFFSQLFVRPPQTTIFAVLHSFSMGMVLIPVSCTMSCTSIHSSSGSLSIRPSPLNLYLTSTV